MKLRKIEYEFDHHLSEEQDQDEDLADSEATDLQDDADKDMIPANAQDDGRDDDEPNLIDEATESRLGEESTLY